MNLKETTKWMNRYRAMHIQDHNKLIEVKEKLRLLKKKKNKM